MDLAEPRIHKEINAKAITGEQGNDGYDNLPINYQRPFNFGIRLCRYRSKSCNDSVLLSLVPGIL